MRRTTPARSAHDARRPARAIHLRAASVVALAALGVGVAPAVAAPLTGTHSAIVTTDKSDAASDGGVSDGDDDQQQSTSPTEESTAAPTASASATTQKKSGQGKQNSPTEQQDHTVASGNESQSASPSVDPSEGGTGNPGDAEEDSHTLTLNRTSVPAGQGIQVSIDGFTDDANARVTGPGETGTFTESKEIPVGEDSAWVSIPRDAKTGEYTVNVTSKSGSAGPGKFEVTPEKHAVPTIDMADEVDAGTTATIEGNDFWTHGKAEVSVNGPSNLEPVKSGEIAKGKFTAEVVVPTTAEAGQYTVTATAGKGDRVKTAKTTFKVPATSSNKPTTGAPSNPIPPSNSSPTSDSPSTSTTSPSSSKTPSSTPSTTPSDSGSSSASTTSEVPPTTSTRDSSKEIELSAPSDDSSPKSTEKSEEKDTSEKPTKDQDSEKAKDEDEKTSNTPQATSDQPVSQQQNDTTDVAATTEDDTTSSGPTTVTTQDDGGGPLVKLFSSIGGEDASGMNRIRQVFVATLGVAFLTAAGFTTASWLSRRSGTHSARAGLRQLFHRRH